MRRITLSLMACIIFLANLEACPTFAQTIAQIGTSEEVRSASGFGVYVHGGLNIHNADFQTLPGVPSCCPGFTNGTGAGINFGAFYTLPISPNFYFDMRLGYSSLGATLRMDEYTTVLVNGNPTQGAFEHSIAASIGMIGLEPLVSYRIFPNVSLLGGPILGWILSNQYDSRETIVQPVNTGVFTDNGQRVRNAYSGVTQDAAKLYAGLSVGAQYRLPLNTSGSLFALPEVFYTAGLTQLVHGLIWHANSLTAGVAVQYMLLPKPAVVSPPPPPPPPPIVEAPKPKPPMLAVSLRLAKVDSGSVAEEPIHELVIEDYIRTQYRPLLNFVFFDKGSSVLPARYHAISSGESKAFQYSDLNDYETLPLYYDVLNILGKRMREYPTAKLTLVGCNDGQSENENKQVSQARAESVFHYLLDTWGVDSNRMKVEVRDLPDKPSTVTDTDGAEENRRVEIYSNVWQVLEPIFTTDTAHIPEPPIVRLLPNGTAESGFQNWQVSSWTPRPEGTVEKLKDFSGSDSLPHHLDWDLEKEREQVLASLDTVHAVLHVQDHAQQTARSDEITLPVRHYTLLDKHREGSIDTIISRYSLILFDFDRGALSDANRRIANFVKARISGESKVSILGYTDRIGSDQYNQQLSELRARSTAHYIGLESRSDVRGLGRSTLLYDNKLPEGRFYSRTVTVVVTTPTKR
jgi:outer membrane protein OmpA-like peptidoglycan-associated protein